MLAALLALELLAASPAAAAPPSPSPLVVGSVVFDPTAPDHAAHLAVSYGLTLTGALLLEKLDLPRWQAVALAGAGAFAIGLGKELLVDDAAEGADLAADGAGVLLAAGLVLVFEL